MLLNVLVEIEISRELICNLERKYMEENCDKTLQKKSNLLCLYKSSKKALQVSQLRVQWGLRTSSKGLTALRGLAPPSGLVPGIVGKVKLLVLDVLLLSAISSPFFFYLSRSPNHVSIHHPFKIFHFLSSFSLFLSPYIPSSHFLLHSRYPYTRFIVIWNMKKKKNVKIKFYFDV